MPTVVSFAQRLLAKDSGFYAVLSRIGSIVSNLCLLASLKFATDYEVLGTVLFAITLAHLYKTILIFGVDTYLMRCFAFSEADMEGCDYNSKVNEPVRVFFISSLFLLPVLFCISTFFCTRFGVSVKDSVFLLLTAWLTSFIHLVSEYFRAKRDFRAFALLSGQNGGFITGALLSALVYQIGEVNLDTFIYLYIVASLFTAFITLMMLLGVFCSRNHTLTFSAMRHGFPSFYSIQECFFCFASNILWEFQVSAPIWIGVMVLDPIQLSDFTFAFRIASPCLILLALQETYYGPSIAKAAVTKQFFQIETILRRVAFIATAPCVAIAAILLMFGSIPLTFVFGQVTDESASLLSIVVVGHAAFTAGGSTSIVLLLNGMSRLVSMLSLLVLFTQVLLGLLLAYLYEGSGLAVSFVLTQVLSRVVGNILCKSNLGLVTFAYITFCQRK